MKHEARVGLVVIIALTMTVFGYFYLRNLGLATDRYYMRVTGTAIVSAGNEVRLRGVKIGQVHSVDLNERQEPMLTLVIKRGSAPFRMLKSYRYAVQPSALIGDNYVDIKGPFNPTAPAYEPNNESQIIEATASGPLSGVTDQATVMLGDMRVAIGKLNVTLDRINEGVLSNDNQLKLAKALAGVAQLTERASQNFGPGGIKLGFGDPRAQNGLAETLQGAAATAKQASLAAADLRVMAADMRSIVKSNKGEVSSLLASFNHTAKEIGGMAEAVTFLVKNGKLSENLTATLTAARKSTENVEAATASIKTLLADPATTGDVKATLAAARKASENVEAVAANIKAVTDAETQKNVRAAIASFTETAAALKTTAQSLKSTLGDPEAQKQLKAALANINSATAKLDTTLDNLKNTSVSIDKMLGDPKFQDDVKSMPGELKSTLGSARETAASLRELADRIGGILPTRKKRGDASTIPPPVAVPAQPRAGVNFPSGLSFTYRNLSSFSGAPRIGADVTGNHYGDLGFDDTLFGSPLRLGLSNVGSGTELTAQTGKYFNQGLALRYGIYRSQLGAGVELRRGKFFAEGNMWDLNNRSHNILGGVQLNKKVELFGGRENIRGVRATTFGVRLRP